MKYNLHTRALVLALAGMTISNASALITIDAVNVGDAGNPNDPTTGFGAVGYNYGIAKYEVTLSQYTAFLNAVGATDTYALYNGNMGAYTPTLGISRSGASGSYTYSVVGNGARPVTWVSWFDSARFSNWLQNGQPTGAQAAGTTETGAYTLNGATSGVGFARNAGSIYGLPTENEWYKAAYYQPAAQGGDTDGYWLYATRSNIQPNSRNGSATDPNSANYNYNDGIANGYNGGYAANNTNTLPTSNLMTSVGAFSLASSFYGTFDQDGNAWEWDDGVIGSTRVLRGGSAGSTEGFLRSSYRYSNPATFEDYSVGFRVIVPEPSVGAMMVMGMVVLAWKRKRTL